MDERSDISGVVGALAVHVDALHWNELLSLFAPEVRIDYTSLFGGECEVMARERLIDNWRQLLPGLTRTCHVIGAPAITLNGETAQVSASVAAWHFVKEPEFAGKDFWLVGGCYEMNLAKLIGSWRIAALTLARCWSEGNLELPKIAMERAAKKGRASGCET